MKVKLSIAFMLITISLVSCQKNSDLVPETNVNQTKQVNSGGKSLPTAIYINDVLERKFTYDAGKHLSMVQEADGTVRKYFYDKNNRLDHMDIINLTRSERIKFYYESSFKGPIAANRFVVTNSANRLAAQVGNGTSSTKPEFEHLISNISIKYNSKGIKIGEKETAVDPSENSFETTYAYDNQGRLKSFVKSQSEHIQLEMSVKEFAEGVNELAGIDVLAFEPGVLMQRGNTKVLYKVGIKIFGHENNQYKLNIFGQPIQVTTLFDDDEVIITKIVY